MPKVGPDKNKLTLIKRVLKNNPDGLWIREIARQTKISKSTVHYYIKKYLSKDVEDVVKVKSNLIRFLRLKK